MLVRMQFPAGQLPLDVFQRELRLLQRQAEFVGRGPDTSRAAGLLLDFLFQRQQPRGHVEPDAGRLLGQLFGLLLQQFEGAAGQDRSGRVAGELRPWPA